TTSACRDTTDARRRNRRSARARRRRGGNEGERSRLRLSDIGRHRPNEAATKPRRSPPAGADAASAALIDSCAPLPPRTRIPMLHENVPACEDASGEPLHSASPAAIRIRGARQNNLKNLDL